MLDFGSFDVSTRFLLDITLIVIVGGVLVYLLWNVFDSLHNKVCDELGKGIIHEEVEHVQCKGPSGEPGK